MKVINLTNKQSRWTVVDLTNTTVQLSGTRRGLCCNLLGDIVRSEMIGRNKDQRILLVRSNCCAFSLAAAAEAEALQSFA
jgi:hypothetical protein